MPDSKLFTFDLPISPKHLHEWKELRQPTCRVCYSLNRNGEVEVRWYTVYPDVSMLILDWEAFKTELQQAAENNAESHKDEFKGRIAPGYRRLPTPQPGEDPWFDAQLEIKWK